MTGIRYLTHTHTKHVESVWIIQSLSRPRSGKVGDTGVKHYCDRVITGANKGLTAGARVSVGRVEVIRWSLLTYTSVSGLKWIFDFTCVEKGSGETETRTSTCTASQTVIFLLTELSFARSSEDDNLSNLRCACKWLIARTTRQFKSPDINSSCSHTEKVGRKVS